jgi:hypothetical protein
MTLSPELLNAIEAGCDGVTPGPWAVMRDKFHFDSLTDIRSEVGQFIASTGGTWEYLEPNAAHIAHLDPATVLELVAGYRAGLKAHADVIRLRALLARIRSALEVPHV